MNRKARLEKIAQLTWLERRYWVYGTYQQWKDVSEELDALMIAEYGDWRDEVKGLAERFITERKVWRA